MAYYPDQEDDERAEENTLTMGSMASGAAGGAAKAGPTTPPPTAQTQGGFVGQAPGRFVNFEKVFNANRDSANTMANTLGNRIEQQGQAAQSKLQGAQLDFTDQLNASQEEFYGPPSANQSKSDLEQRANAKYKGPSSIAAVKGFADVAKEADTAAKTANQASTTSGIQAFQSEGNAGRTAGQSRFDAALTQQAGRDRFERLGQTFGGLSKDVNASLAGTHAAAGRVRDGMAGEASRYQTALDRWKDEESKASAGGGDQGGGGAPAGPSPKNPLAYFEGFRPDAAAERVLASAGAGAAQGSGGGFMGAGAGMVAGGLAGLAKDYKNLVPVKGAFGWGLDMMKGLANANSEETLANKPQAAPTPKKYNPYHETATYPPRGDGTQTVMTYDPETGTWEAWLKNIETGQEVAGSRQSIPKEGVTEEQKKFYWG
jgi:hypothetical protein